MRKLLIIAHRELAAMVATRAFLVTLVMMPILMFGGVVLMPQLSSMGGGQTKRIVVADGTGQLFESLKQIADKRNEALRKDKPLAPQSTGKPRGGFDEKQDFYELEPAPSQTLDDAQRLELSNEIRAGKLYAFVEIPANVLDGTEMPLEPQAEQSPPADQSPQPAQIVANAQTVEPNASAATFVSQDALLSSSRQWITSTVGERIRSTRLKRLGLDPAIIARASRPLEFAPKAPYKATAPGEAANKESANVFVALLLPFGVMMLMFMVIFLAAQPMLESGMEEKSHRIAEVLLGSVSPFQLMAGKLIGNVAGSMLIFAIYGIGGWLILDSNDLTKELPWELMPWFVVFQLLGVLLYSSVFLAIGASVSEMKEAQSLLMPIWFVLLSPMMVWFVALRDPNGPIATGMSFLPPSAPLMMILRLATGQSIPAWQAPLSAALLVVSTAIVLVVAGRIYRSSLLRTDSARTIRQLFARI